MKPTKYVPNASARSGVRLRKEQLPEHQSRGGAVQQEVVPLDGRADRTGNERTQQHVAALGWFHCERCR
jgi:hypothetical protein